MGELQLYPYRGHSISAVYALKASEIWIIRIYVKIDSDNYYCCNILIRSSKAVVLMLQMKVLERNLSNSSVDAGMWSSSVTFWIFVPSMCLLFNLFSILFGSGQETVPLASFSPEIGKCTSEFLGKLGNLSVKLGNALMHFRARSCSGIS